MRHHAARQQRGAVAVEFGLVGLLLFTALIGAIEVGRLMWTWNAAAEATRLGARLAATCDQDVGAVIRARMRARLPALQDEHITIDYLNPSSGGGGTCTQANCRLVTVALTGYRHSLLVPALSLSLPIPPFTTTVSREVMDSTHPACH